MTHLPTKRTFLVRLSDEADPDKGLYCGRVEHLQSGQVAKFQSRESLSDFFSSVLKDQESVENSVLPGTSDRT